jgi:hypothetical protein
LLLTILIINFCHTKPGTSSTNFSSHRVIAVDLKRQTQLLQLNLYFLLDWTFNSWGQLAETAGPPARTTATAINADQAERRPLAKWPGKAVHWRLPSPSPPQQPDPVELSGSECSSDTGTKLCLKYTLFLVPLAFTFPHLHHMAFFWYLSYLLMNGFNPAAFTVGTLNPRRGFTQKLALRKAQF